MDKTQMEIKKDHRKALPKFLLCVALSAVIGGAVGFISAQYPMDSLRNLLKTAANVFALRIAPWLLIAEAIGLPARCVPRYRAVKMLLNEWDGEDETVSDAADQRLSAVLWWSDAALILAFFLLAAAYSGGMSMFAIKKNVIYVSVAIAGFLAVFVESVLMQQRAIDAMRRLYPEKKVSIYDLKFQKKLMETMDEAEKIMVGQSAIKAFQATNSACMALAVALAVAALVLNIGFLPSLAVCVIWLTNQRAYCRESMRLSKAGTRVR